MKVLSRLLCLVLCLPLMVMGQEKITWKKDGKEMVLIPAGSFEMGDVTNEPGDGMKASKPIHTVELVSFYMDVNEVTVGQFKQFVNQSGYSYDRWVFVTEYSPGDEYPMVYVTWNDAAAYAEWAGKRLPTGSRVGIRSTWGLDRSTVSLGR